MMETDARTPIDKVNWLNRLIRWLLFGSLIFAPWAFGSTQPWAIKFLNTTGSLLGGLWLIKKIFHTAPPTDFTNHWTTKLLFTSIIATLGYNLFAALNAAAEFHQASAAFVPLPHLSWLPHSYDRRAGWMACWQNFALAGTFMATRDWLQAGHKNVALAPGAPATGLLSSRARQLLLLLVANGALLAVVALLQRLDRTDKLLWLVQPRINRAGWEQFGPFAYRSNGFQYLALVWPIGLGLWSMFAHAHREKSFFGSRRGNWMLAAALLLLICPLFWQSRLAVAVDLIAAAIAIVILVRSHRAERLRKMLAGGILLLLLVGLVLNWSSLTERFTRSGVRSVERWQLFQAGGEMFRDNWLFGTGPGSFRSLYHLYRPEVDERWHVYMHNDWLETLTTYGVTGFALVAVMFVCLFCAPLNPRGWPARKSFIAFTALGLGCCLLHATLDFPFQIYSIQQLFVVLAAFYSTLGRPG